MSRRNYPGKRLYRYREGDRRRQKLRKTERKAAKYRRSYHNGFVGGTAIMGGPLHRTTFFVALRHKKNARILLRAECGRFDIRRCLSSKRIRVKGCL